MIVATPMTEHAQTTERPHAVRGADARGTDVLSGLRRVVKPGEDSEGPVPLLDREWLVTNGPGGYASGTLCGAATRRDPGWPLPAHPPPPRRPMMFNPLLQKLPLPNFCPLQFAGPERVGGRPAF